MFPITLALMLALPPATHSPLPLIIGFPIMLSSLFGLLFAVLARPRNQGSLQYLWQSNDVSAIGPLLESVRLLLPEVTKRADSALLRLLPRIETEHIDLLTPYQRRRLRAYVGAERDLEPNYSALKLEGIGAGQIEAARAAHKQRAECRRSSALAVVRALLIAGTNEDIPLVARLADGHGVAFEDVELIGEANACLCELLSRREIRERDATYLRAALKPAASGDTLLRAGTSQTETTSEHLLKASTPPLNPPKP